MQMVLGIGAWITAIAALFFVGVVMDLVLDIDEPNLVVAVVGAMRIRRKPVAAATAGPMARSQRTPRWHSRPRARCWPRRVRRAGGEALGGRSRNPAVCRRRDLAATIAAAAVPDGLDRAHPRHLAAWDHWDDLVVDLPAIFIPVGVALLLYPPRHDVRPTAFALLIVPLADRHRGPEFEGGWTLWFGWPARGMLLAVFACCLRSTGGAWRTGKGGCWPLPRPLPSRW